MKLSDYKESAYNVVIELAEDDCSLIFNTLTHAFSMIERAELCLLREAFSARVLVTPAEHGLFDRFLLNGFAVPCDVSEVRALEQQFAAARNDRSTMVLTLAPTLFCNFACDYCYEGTAKSKEKMSDEVINNTVSYVKRHADVLKSLHVAWYGGEPLLALDVMRELSHRLIELCDSYGIVYSAAVVTNGYGLTKVVANTLAKLKVTVVQITLDGPAECHDARRHLLSRRGTFDTIVNNIASWIDEVALTVNLRVNIDSRNRDHIVTLIHNLEARGLSDKRVNMYFAPVEASTEGCAHVSDLALDKDDYAGLETELYRDAFDRKLAPFPQPPRFMGLCGALRPNSLVVIPNGDLHKCWHTVTYPHLKIGNIRDIDALSESDLAHVWNDWNPFQSEACRSCKLLPNCAGACAYKFVHYDKTTGTASIPCPSWKFNIKEKLLSLAYLKGFVTADQMPKAQNLDV